MERVALLTASGFIVRICGLHEPNWQGAEAGQQRADECTPEALVLLRNCLSPPDTAGVGSARPTPLPMPLHRSRPVAFTAFCSHVWGDRRKTKALGSRRPISLPTGADITARRGPGPTGVIHARVDRGLELSMPETADTTPFESTEPVLRNEKILLETGGLLL